MDSLLEKIQSIEASAQSVIKEAQDKRTAELKKISSEEEKALTWISDRSEGKVQEIVKEAVTKAEAEANQTIQHEQKAVELTHEAAKKNKKAAIEKVVSLFTAEHLKS